MTINKDQLQSAFPGLTDQEAQRASTDEAGFVRDYAQRTGQDENQVRQTLQSAKSQGGQGSTQR